LQSADLNSLCNFTCESFGFAGERRCRSDLLLPQLCYTLRHRVEPGYKLRLSFSRASGVRLFAQPQIGSGLIYPLQLEPM
jgi:hypothetical protein